MKPRVYGAWVGNNAGVREDKSRCIKEVWPGSGRGWIPYQCLRKRGYGPNGEYCKQHGREAEKRDWRDDTA
jgi:hypothetical protein